MYYTNYGMKIASGLAEYFDSIKMFELNSHEDGEDDADDADDADVETNLPVHDFRLLYKNKRIAYVSMSHSGIAVNNLIPEKLMKICRYRKNAKISQKYTKKYDKICSNIYKKIKKNNKYSDMTPKSKDKIIFEPICDLIHDTIGKTRKCANNLYSYIFSESDRIVLKLYKNRFKIYDFGIDKGAITSYSMKVIEKDQIHITFSNGAEFHLRLHTNSYNVKQHISLKFRSKFVNMDEMFSICSVSI